jgi:predicted O-methyltransferase YrrM
MKLSDFSSDLENIINIANEAGSRSLTSPKYQAAILSFILENKDKGTDVIEIGSYKGGMTSRLAYICKQINQKLYTIDIAPKFIKTTEDLLKKLKLNSHVTTFAGSFDDFSKKFKFTQNPLLVVIDGAHDYQSVYNDIQTCLQLNKPTYAIAFHDFSLRYPPDLAHVDKAIYDSFGEDIPLQKIGEQIDADTVFPTKEKPNKDEGYYWEQNGSEGVILLLENWKKQNSSN